MFKLILLIILFSLVFLMVVFSRMGVDYENLVSSKIEEFEKHDSLTARDSAGTTSFSSSRSSTDSVDRASSPGDHFNTPRILTDETQVISKTPPPPVSVDEMLPKKASPKKNSSFLFMDEGPSWSDPFCNEFFSNRFSVKMSPCGGLDRVTCYGSPFDDKMGTCILHGVAMDTHKFYQIMFDDKDSVRTSQSLWLVPEQKSNKICPDPNFENMEKKMFGGDYVKRVTQTAILTSPQKECGKWINGTSFMFMGFDDHIYFKYLSWFSLHNGILNYELESGKKPSLIIRIPELKGSFTHEEYEQRLFPEAKLMSLKDFSIEYPKSVCFEKLIITPWAYSTNAFRCKMSDAVRRLRNKCYGCKGGAGLVGTRFMSFRRRALAACSIHEDDKPHPKSLKRIVLQVRKAYIRRLGDNLNKFSRVMENPEEVINGLKKSFPDVEVYKMIAEEMEICEQIRLVHDADVLIGVHGAGLVHLWWLKDHALLFEMVPSRQKSNPSFKMLSTLTGRRYYGYEKLKGAEKKIIVDVPDIVMELKRHF